MSYRNKLLAWVLGSAVLWMDLLGMLANDSANPYHTIVERNLFGLKPAPPPPAIEPALPKLPMPRITLTGITTILGGKHALMKVPPPQPRPGELPKGNQYFLLAEGQRDGELEVLAIDERAGIVQVNYGGTITNLTFADTVAKLSNSPSTVPPLVNPQRTFTRPVPTGFPSNQIRMPYPTRSFRNRGPLVNQPGLESTQ